MKTLVLVEDDLMLASTFIRVLGKTHNILHFLTVKDARAHLALNPTPDVLLLDRQVGYDNGWALREEVGTGVRVVLMTGAPPQGNSLTFFHKGVDNIQKLISMVEG